MGLFKRGQGWLKQGDDRQFVEAAYRFILGRPADQGGLEHYAGRLASGELSRDDLLKGLLCSEECGRRRDELYDVTQVLFDFVEVWPADEFLPHVADKPLAEAQLCELTNPRKWLEPRWREFLLSLQVVPGSLTRMHRKGFEWTQAAYGLDLLGKLGDDIKCLGVGSGHEALVYWLANHTGHVLATDLYEGSWTKKGSREGDPAVLADADRYAPFDYRRDRLEFRRMDGTSLELDDASFDVCFSMSSIEHFGGNAQAAKAMAEMGRVLKPGGVIALATEAVLNDKDDKEFFRFPELARHVVAASGCRLVQAPVFRVPRYALEHPTHMPHEQALTPHLVLEQKGVLYTSVMLFLQKPA